MSRLLLTCALGCMAALGTNAIAGEIVYSNNFDTGLTTDFTGGTIITAPNSSTNFLEFGGAGGSATLTLTGLDPHTAVDLSFTLDVVGSMDGGPPAANGGGPGDFFNVTYSGGSSGNIFSNTFANFDGGNTQNYGGPNSAPGTGAFSINALGYSGFPNSGNGIQDSEYTISLTPVVDSNGTISFTFTDNSNEGMSNEFYGIDNVLVSTDGTPGGSATPEPASFILGAFGLLALPAGRYFRRLSSRQS